jgi:hypothetical protein
MDGPIVITEFFSQQIKLSVGNHFNIGEEEPYDILRAWRVGERAFIVPYLSTLLIFY